ncbi:MAG: acyl--CoA ligase [archaeon]|nr:acyl--CoA ligase [archaeon]
MLGSCQTAVAVSWRRGLAQQHDHHQEKILIPDYFRHTLSIPRKSLPHLILEKMEAVEPSKMALECSMTGVKLTYGDALKQIHATAGWLAEKGLKNGDTMLINAPNIPHYAVWFHGALLANGIVSPASPMLTLEELVTQLVDSNSKFIVTCPMLAEVSLEAAHAVGIPRERVIIHGGEASGPSPNHAAVFSHPGKELPPFQRDLFQDIAVLPYSSGTTGKSKGVMLSHHNLVANLLQTCHAEKPTPWMIGILPFYHIYGLMLLLNYSLYNGVSTAVMPKFDLPVFLETMQRYRIETAHLVPPIILALAKHPLVANYDLSCLKMIFSGAAPLGREVQQAVEARLGCRTKQAWGMSELSPAATVTPTDNIKIGSSGPLLPNTLGRVVALDGDGAPLHDCPAGKEGEIWIKGPQVMLGYLNRPEATKETLTSAGWLRTGDTGYYDEQGYVYITDRIKEFLKYKGHQVAPAELEAVLLSHPQVADCCVVGSPSEEAGELPKAFVVLQANVTPSDDLGKEIIAHVSKHVAPYKKLHLIEFIQAIPKSPAGKILRRVLRAQERETAKGLKV